MGSSTRFRPSMSAPCSGASRPRFIAPTVRPINVLDLRDTHEIGGPGKTILETYRAIDHDRFRLHLGVFRAPDDRTDTPFLSLAREMGMPIHDIGGRGPYDLTQIRRLATFARDGQFDIVHSHETSSAVITYAMSILHLAP